MAGQRFWWDVYGPFDPDEDRYPNAGQVVKHYRLLKRWSPAQLGEAMGKTARWVQAMEHDNMVPEAISRRRALAAILGIPPILLGLAPMERISHVIETVKAASKQQSATIDASTLNQYHEFLRLYWELDYSSTAQESLADITRWTRHLQALLSETTGTQQLQIAELLCRYHQLATWIARDQRDYITAYAHANRALKIAHATENPELIAAALFRRGRTHLEEGNIAGAIEDLDMALPIAQHTRSQLKGLVLLAAGHAHAHKATSSTTITQCLALIDQAGRIVRRGNLEDDESFVKLNTGRFHLDRAGALVALHRPDDALDELELADHGIGPDQTRRHAYINVLRAQAYAQTGEALISLATAESTLIVSKALKSTINIARIAELHDRLKQGKLANSPQLARLGVSLATK